jgi:hypothetical protein
MLESGSPQDESGGAIQRTKEESTGYEYARNVQQQYKEYQDGLSDDSVCSLYYICGET